MKDSGGRHLRRRRWPAWARRTGGPRRAALIRGLDRGTTAAHLARATLEGIALSVFDLAEAMRVESGQPFPDFKVDGGASRNDLLMQFQADLLGVPVVRPRMIETTALGAAFLAGLAVGVWRRRTRRSAGPGRSASASSRRCRPTSASHHLAKWRKAVENA